MSSFGDDAPILIQTKLHRPRLGQDLISRPHLIRRLNQGVDRKLTLISAQAGAGKSTLLAQWLRQCPQQSAWLSLDEDDNNLMVFVSYLCAAIQSVFPDTCEHALDLLNGPVTPPPRIITASLVNELAVLCNGSLFPDDDGSANAGLILAFDDYHTIKEPSIHELVSELIAYLPQCVHLALSTRTDPPLPLAGLRARWEMTELRTNDLQFTSEEAGALLELSAGRRVSHETVNLLTEKTEGWVVGLRLAALSIRDLPDDRDFAQKLEGTSSSIIADYMMSEVLARQSPSHQDFLLRSSILNRFNAELCEAVLRLRGDSSSTNTEPGIALARIILSELRSANLFLLRLDQEERWFRYHHLFRDLLQHRLRGQHDPEYIRTLHSRASQWFEEKGFTEEALSHMFAAGNLDGAAQIVAGQRYKLMNEARWQHLDRLLQRFPAQFIAGQPDLLLLKAWLIYHRGHFDQLPAELKQVEAALVKRNPGSETGRYLNGEVSALRSLIYYFQSNPQRAIAEARIALRDTAPEIWIVRILARMYLAGANQMIGNLQRAYEVIYQGIDEESNLDNDRYRATMLITVGHIYWIAADLQSVMAAAKQCLKFSDYAYSAEIRGMAHYHLGSAHYELNNLVAAEQQFLNVTSRPYLNYGTGLAHSAFGLALTYLAQERPDKANRVAAMAVDHMVQTDNTTLLPLARAFQAELALRQGRLAIANLWAVQFDSLPPLSPLVQLYQYHFTLVKIWLANDTSRSRQQATSLLKQLQDYVEATHNTYALAKVLALQAILALAEDDEPSALRKLEAAMELTQPGGFLRLFVDLGSPMAYLLQTLQDQGETTGRLGQYLAQILAAFPEPARDQNPPDAGSGPEPARALVEPLTSREMEVLELLGRRLTNKEIAERLFVSPQTVKTHTLSIYTKLDVHGRRQAVDKAREIGLISPI